MEHGTIELVYLPVFFGETRCLSWREVQPAIANVPAVIQRLVGVGVATLACSVREINKLLPTTWRGTRLLVHLYAPCRSVSVWWRYDLSSLVISGEMCLFWRKWRSTATSRFSSSQRSPSPRFAADSWRKEVSVSSKPSAARVSRKAA